MYYSRWGFSIAMFVYRRVPDGKHIWVFPKIGVDTPKMDGENNGKP